MQINPIDPDPTIITCALYRKSGSICLEGIYIPHIIYLKYINTYMCEALFNVEIMSFEQAEMLRAYKRSKLPKMN